MANFSFLTIARTFSFHLILTSGPIFIAKNIFSWWMLLRWVLGVCSIRIFAKNIGNPYYKPTIMVHDNMPM